MRSAPCSPSCAPPLPHDGKPSSVSPSYIASAAFNAREWPSTPASGYIELEHAVAGYC
jgi:hypothetical protein